MANNHTDAIKRNLKYIPEFGRWDDLYEFINTPLEKDALDIMYHQLSLDVQSKTPSLLGKWLKSENTSSTTSRRIANKTREYFGMTHREYRKTLSILRERIKVIERLMSAGRWDEIEFDKIPSKAGMIYRNAFAKHDIDRMRLGAEKSYKEFAENKNTKVNTDALYPYDVVRKALDFSENWGYYYGKKSTDLNDTERLMINKYWDNLKDVFNGYAFNGICVCDVSGSMYGMPMAVAISIAMYCAEHNSGPFANHFFTFSHVPTFMTIEGIDFVDKVNRISESEWGMNTNIEAVFDKMLNIALENDLDQKDIPETIIVISDMEFDHCITANRSKVKETLFESIEKTWKEAGYKMPRLTFWNCDARQDNIPMRKEGHVNFVSGCSQNIFEQVMKGLSAIDLMMDKLNSERYNCIK